MNDKISFLLGSFSGGGAERVMVTLANKFYALGYKIDFLVLSDTGPYRNDLVNGINKIVLSKNTTSKFWKYASAITSLIKYISKQKPTHVISTLHEMNILNILINKKANTIVREANSIEYLFTNQNLKKKLLFKAIKYLYPKASHVVTLSEVMKDDLLRRIPAVKNISVIHNPLDLEKFSHMQKQNIPTPTIVACGRLTKGKNFKDLVLVTNELKNKYPNITVNILGEGSERQNLQELIDANNLSENVKLVGFVDNPYEFYTSSSVFVQTSLMEGFPNVMIESMACKIPVVVYDSKGAMREILQDGKYGELVKTGNLESLKQLIINQIENPISQELLAECINRFSLDEIASNYLNILGLQNEK